MSIIHLEILYIFYYLYASIFCTNWIQNHITFSGYNQTGRNNFISFHSLFSRTRLWEVAIDGLLYQWCVSQKSQSCISEMMKRSQNIHELWYVWTSSPSCFPISSVPLFLYCFHISCFPMLPVSPFNQHSKPICGIIVHVKYNKQLFG